jgi:hypothetical protein
MQAWDLFSQLRDRWRASFPGGETPIYFEKWQEAVLRFMTELHLYSRNKFAALVYFQAGLGVVCMRNAQHRAGAFCNASDHGA